MSSFLPPPFFMRYHNYNSRRNSFYNGSRPLNNNCGKVGASHDCSGLNKNYVSSYKNGYGVEHFGRECKDTYSVEHSGGNYKDGCGVEHSGGNYKDSYNVERSNSNCKDGFGAERKNSNNFDFLNFLPRSIGPLSFNPNGIMDNKEPIFELLGIDIFIDDIIIIGILIFLYKQEVKDEGLYLVLIMLLFS